MLNLVRKHADSWLIKSILWTIVFAFIGTIFYSWGMGGSAKLSGGVIATVEGVKINYNEYDATFKNLLEFYREQFKNQFSEEMVRRLDLKTVALDAIIQKKLLLMEAKKENIHVGDEEVAARIKTISAFQKNQKFNQETYKNFLKFKHLTPFEFEESQRETLMMEKMEQLIRDNVKVSPEEIVEGFKKEEEKTKLEYVVLPGDLFRVAAQNVSQEEKKSYYEKNKLQFEVPENIRVEYVKLDPRDYESGIEINDEEIQEYYKEQIAKFRVEKHYRASHVLFRIDPPKPEENASEEEKKNLLADAEKAAKAKAEDVLKKVREEGASFEEMAKQLSDDKVSGAQGGDLGEFPRGTMVPEFEAALDKLKPGEISQPVLTPFGYHLVKLTGQKDERIKPLSEVTESVTRSLKENKAKQKVRRMVKQIFRAAQGSGDLNKASAEHQIPVKKTEYFSAANHNLADIGTVPEFYNLAFSLKDNELGPPLNTTEASYLMKIVERKPAYVPELAEVEKNVEETVAREKSKTLTAEKFKEFEKQLASDADLEKFAKTQNLSAKLTPFFGLEDSIPGIGNNQEIKEQAFKLKKGETAGVWSRNKFYLIKVADKQAAGDPNEEQTKRIQKHLKKEKGDVYFQEWLKNLREKADIKIDRTLL
ncbi:MAG: SurA N-terminal domain-containing protein [Nitrospinae bacterium]|nr:SurA N-terminal domain-containing protein [Nitrospinota bacterium]